MSCKGRGLSRAPACYLIVAGSLTEHLSTGQAASDPGRQEDGEGGGQVRVTRCGVCVCVCVQGQGTWALHWGDRRSPLPPGQSQALRQKAKAK